MTRRRISTKERLAIFTRENGTCHLCKGPVTVGQPWDVSHDIPLELGGADEGDNLKVAHKHCHRDHTARVDLPTIAKAKRREAKHVGARAAPVKKIQSPGFPASPKVRVKRESLPPRPMFR